MDTINSVWQKFIQYKSNVTVGGTLKSQVMMQKLEEKMVNDEVYYKHEDERE